MRLLARRRRVRRSRSPCARARGPCRCSMLGLGPRRRRARRRRSARSGCAAGCRGGRSPAAVVVAAGASPTCRRSPATASSTRRSTATRTRRPRGTRPPPRSTPATPAATGCCSCPAPEFGAFRWGYTVDPPLPGLTDRPLVTRDLLPARAARRRWTSLYALDDRFQAGTVEPGVDRPGRPAARRRHDLAHRRRRVRPLPHAAPRARRATSSPTACPGSATPMPYGEPVRQRRPTSRWSTSSRCPTPASASRCRRSSWCRSTTRCRSSGPRTTSCSSPAAATGSSTPPRAGLHRRHAS